MHILAIDQGTSGTKAVVTDEAGQVLATVEEPVHPRYLDGGGVEQDARELLDSVLQAGRRAAAEAGVPLAAVALANQGETVVAWDRDTGDPQGPAIVWQDRRAEQICADRAGAADRVAELTGLVLDPYFSAPKMRWLREHRTTAGVVTTTDTWLVHQLCGAFVTDASTASRSLLLDLDAVRWSDELVDLFGLGSEERPQIVASDTIVGTTTAFGGELPVTGLIVDQQAALLAENCLRAGTAKCTYGTGAFLLAQLGSAPVRSRAGLSTSVAWRLRVGTSYCVDGQVYTAASAVRWLHELGLITGADQLDSAAAPNGDGVLCVPALAGLAAPWWDSSATASFTGMTLSTRPGHLVRAVLEGVAAQVAELITLTGDELGAPLTRLRVDGGLTRSRVLMQAQADLAQLPVEVYPSPHATALGAAACARLALDSALSPAAVTGGWQPAATYEPAWSTDRAAEHLGRWHAAARACLSKEAPWRWARHAASGPQVALAPPTFDIAVIGGGLVGAAVARLLGGTSLSTVLVEGRDDVGDGTSKANTAILHTGFDATPGTLESELVARGYHLLGAYAAAAGIPVERTGALLVAWTPEQLDALPGLQAKAEKNGYTASRLVGPDEVYRRVPQLGPGALGGLTVPGESIICTWTANLALATDAVNRGVTLLRGHRVSGVHHDGSTTWLSTSAGPIGAGWVINAAGLGADVIDGYFGYQRFTVTPRRGELLVFDKLARPKVPCIVLPVPSKVGKGVLISPTIYGNVMLGPTAEDLDDRTATGTTEEGFAFLRAKGEELMPALLREEVTAAYAGLRAAIDRNDYLIDVDDEQRYVLIGGIRSTGLTAGMAIAEHVGALLASRLDVTQRAGLPVPPSVPNLGEAGVRPYQDAAAIAADPEYGRIVCFCERVTRGEIRDAYASVIPPADLDGLRRRTRAMNGRCQGFYCGAEIRVLVEQGRVR